VAGLNIQTVGDAFTFGAIISFLAAIFAGWLGGLLAPSHAAVVARPATAVVHEDVRTVEQRSGAPVPAQRKGAFRFLPAMGRKGGEPAERHEHVEPDGDREVHEPPVEPR